MRGGQNPNRLVSLLHYFLDVGRTISNALREADEEKKEPKKLRDKAKVLNSESNGSLMRITPLAVFLSKVENKKDFAQLVKAEVSLTHSSEIVKEAAVCYCIAVQSLLKEGCLGDRNKAYEEAW
jgi:ADP-ribosyl-[dinitrogen reductase] hydrolase